MAGNSKDFIVNILADTAGALSEMDGFSKSVGTIALGVGAAWTAADIGGKFMDSIEKGVDVQASQNMLEAALPPEQAAAAGAAAGELFADGLTDNLDEVNDAVRAVSQNIGSVAEFGEDGFERVTGKAMTLAQVMGEDVGAETAAVASMMRSRLAPDADAALDVIAAGFQTGADKAGDLLDTFTEYSVIFQQLGLSGAQALGLINQGLDAGARNSDIVADALKEFALRAQEAMVTPVDPAAVAAAQQAVVQATQQANRQMEQSAEAVRQAHERVAETMRGVERAQYGVVQASRGVRDAHRDVAEAARGVRDAEYDLEQTQIDETRAQEALTQARKDAAQQLADMSDRLVDAQLSQRSAELGVRQAQENLDKLKANPEADALDVEQAKLAYDQAVQRLKEQTEQVKRAQEAKAEADAKGVEGSDQVVSAQDRVKDSARGVEQAQQGVRDATYGVREANQQVRDALRAVTEAEQGVKDARRDVANAQRDLAQTQRDATAAQVEGAAAVQAATAALAAAQTPQLTTIGQAYQQLGLDGKQIGDDVAAGGDRARQALTTVLDALRGVKDPATRAQLAVQLFGTKAEDMQQALFALDPSTATEGLDDVAGAADRVTDTVNDGLARDAQEWRNKLDTFQAGLIDLDGPAGKVVGTLYTFGPAVGGIVMTVAPLVGGLASMAAAHSAAAAGAGAQAGANGLLSGSFVSLTIAAAPWILAIAAIAAGAYLIIKNWDSIKGWAKDAGRWVGGFFEDAWDKAQDLFDWFRDNWPKVLAFITGPIGLAVLGLVTHWDDVVGFINGLPKRIANGGVGVVNAFIGIANGIIGAWNGIDIGIHVSMPDWLGGYSFDVDDMVPDIPTINKITKLATGGITNGPMLAVVGDNAGGREVVTPLDELWAEFDALVARPLDGLAAAIDGPASGGDGRTVTVVVNLDGREIARNQRAVALQEAF